MAPFMNSNTSPGIPRSPGPQGCLGFNAPRLQERNYTFSGITKDASGVALPFCTVVLFAASGALEQVSFSDATGAYAFICDKTRTFFAIAVLAGTPEVRGLTLTIAPS